MPSARPLSPAESAELRAAAEAGVHRLKTRADAPPEAVARALHDFLDAWRHGRGTGSPDTLGVELGALWGDQLVRALGWRWASVQHEATAYYGVVSPEARWVAYPLHFLHGLLSDRAQANSTLLLFEMLVAGNVPAADPGAFTAIG